MVEGGGEERISRASKNLLQRYGCLITENSQRSHNKTICTQTFTKVAHTSCFSTVMFNTSRTLVTGISRTTRASLITRSSDGNRSQRTMDVNGRRRSDLIFKNNDLCSTWNLQVAIKDLRSMCCERSRHRHVPPHRIEYPVRIRLSSGCAKQQHPS